MSKLTDRSDYYDVIIFLSLNVDNIERRVVDSIVSPTCQARTSSGAKRCLLRCLQSLHSSLSVGLHSQ